MAEFVTDVFLVTARDSDISTFILETTTKNHDANLWESSWRNKAKRFIGYKRDPDDEYVVTDITIISEDKDVPDDYAGLLITKDTSEKGVRKHIICYKRDSRSTARQAITEINVINQGKAELVPAQYTAINHSINELSVVFKLEDVPSQRAPIPTPRTQPPVHIQQHLKAAASSPSSPVAGIDGVPFQINPKYNAKAVLNDPVIGGITQISIDDLVRQFNYSFDTEKRVVNT